MIYVLHTIQMFENITPIVVGVVIWLILGYLVAKIYFLLYLRKHRKQAVQKSRQVITGQVSEQIAPLLPDFPYHYKDVMFMGKWVDYIVFEGLSQWYISNITFLEIKTGNAQLNKNERMIKDCVQRGSLDYVVWRKS